MPTFYIVGLMLFVVVLAVILVRYVQVTVDKEFQHLARAENDADYRKNQLAQTNRLLADAFPDPGTATPIPPPPKAGFRISAPVLFFLGVALLWGGVFAHENREVWLWGGALSCLLAIVVMLATVKRRKCERLARLLRYRADLRRLDGDKPGSIADLKTLVQLTPWDDAAWAELSDDLASQNRLDEALEAIQKAVAIDPRYDDYRMLETSLALRLGRAAQAGEAFSRWEQLAGGEAGDPRLAIYKAAIQLAGGSRDEAAKTLRTAADQDPDLSRELVKLDQALDGLMELLPAGAAMQAAEIQTEG